MKHVSCTCTVSPEEVDAGADMTLRVRVTGLRKGDAGGSHVSIRNRDGAELANAGLDPSDDGTYESTDIVLTAPREAGEYVYRAAVVAPAKGDRTRALASADVHFFVRPHESQLNVWDVPPTVVVGERFTFKVGVRCSAGCDLHGYGLSIVSHGRMRAGAAKLGRDIWPGTDALYFTEVEAEAPAAIGQHSFEVRTGEWESELPHVPGAVTLALRVVGPPDCEVTVEVVDRAQQTPIEGAVVVLHPYRATTDADGIAKLKVTKGRYDVMVSGPGYVSSSIATEVAADMITRAELDEEPPEELEYGY